MTDHSSSSSAETQSLTSTTTTATRLSLKRRISLSLHRSRNHSSAPKPPNRGLGHSIHRITTAAGAPINKAVNLLGAEGFMPQTMDRECAKASRILHAFTDDPGPAPASSYKAPSHPLGLSVKSMVTIPHKVLANCSGLAVFNTLRAGAYMGSLAAGSGIVVARRPDGTWSPPSSFVVSTLGAGFMIGLDIYDCVLVLNTPAQVAAFAHPRVSLGAESSVAIGPVGTGGAVEAALSKTGRPMFSYIKSRGFWAGVQIDGTIILARQDCNGVAYQNRRISAKKILTLQAEWPEGSQPLWQTLMAMEGRYAIDPDIAREMAAMGPPGDLTPPATGYMTPSSLPPPLEEDEEDEDGPAPPYAASVASEWRYDGSEEGVTQEPIVEEKERLGRAGY
ncbi:hypothetical protein CkaCkLH20_10668 [Colletotrichum karsti]|uniref:Ysc84 actin-binding domain-containing protein n=1 Tax=Colletotrichum karsti TaxID=1095194 RepID=A0A9P6HWM5_9PEZI|nr:uncharacterized protein CkaCkLH20_10668 [Colletotrichum karsti]KAF9871734.1 hypothetical protein CkaCkLH20_10668 [Colletotrichum karsti]